jgi:hypothetical protein
VSRRFASAAALVLPLACLCLSLGLTPAPAQAAPPFESWTPLGHYPRAALREGSAFVLEVPTRAGLVRLSLRPTRVAAPGYHGVRLDAAGRRTGVGAPPVRTWAATLEPAGPDDFARVSFEPAARRLSGLLRVDGVLYSLAAELARGDWAITVEEITEEELASLLAACGLEAHEALEGGDGDGATATSGDGSALGLLEIELGTEADAPFVAQMGSVDAANARILAVVNLMNGIYETDLGLTNRVVVQRAWSGSDPYTSSDSGTLLGEFRSDFSANVATRHDDAQLFSGRDFDSSYVGRAYVSGVCGSYAYGVNQARGFDDSRLSIIVSHEEGHTLGAGHTTDGVMASSLGSTAPYFNANSRGQIATRVDSVSCLAPAASGEAPSLDPVGPQAAREGETLEIQLVASDPDGDALAFGASPLPPGATLDANGLFRWQPAFDTAGCSGTTDQWVEFQVSDGGQVVSEIVPISVADVPTGAVPVLEDPADRSIEAGRTLQIQLRARDADGDALVYAADALPDGATLSATGTFTWTPDAADAGDTAIRFRATDCTGRSDARDVVVTVSAAVAPRLDAIGPDTGSHRSEVTIRGAHLRGTTVEVWFGSRGASLKRVTDGELVVSVPKAPKGATSVPVQVVRDGMASNSLTFTYADGGKGGGGHGKGGKKK